MKYIKRIMAITSAWPRDENNKRIDLIERPLTQVIPLHIWDQVSSPSLSDDRDVAFYKEYGAITVFVKLDHYIDLKEYGSDDLENIIKSNDEVISISKLLFEGFERSNIVSSESPSISIVIEDTSDLAQPFDGWGVWNYAISLFISLD